MNRDMVIVSTCVLAVYAVVLVVLEAVGILSVLPMWAIYGLWGTALLLGANGYFWIFYRK